MFHHFHPSIFLAKHAMLLRPWLIEVVGQGIERSICLAPAEALRKVIFVAGF